MLKLSEREARLWLASVMALDPGAYYSLVEEMGCALAVWENPTAVSLTAGRRKRLFEHCDDEYFEKLAERVRQADCKVLLRGDDGYPRRLDYLDDPPPALYVRGSADLDGDRAMAVVGSRHCTRDGLRASRELSEQLARAGVAVVSGLAYGADGAAHEGCLSGGGVTLAVMGTGVDLIYPSDHQALAKRILDSGGALISELPPGTGGAPRNFPPRNRIISGLADGVLLIEGRLRSGAMITVRYAREQRRPLFAVPSGIYNELGEAPNALLAEGAQAVISAEQVLSYFHWPRAYSPAPAPEQRAKVELSAVELAIVNKIKNVEMSFDELVNCAGLPPSELNSLLTTLEMRRIIVRSAGRLYRASV